jgi:hypothetical protein
VQVRSSLSLGGASQSLGHDLGLAEEETEDFILVKFMRRVGRYNRTIASLENQIKSAKISAGFQCTYRLSENSARTSFR